MDELKPIEPATQTDDGLYERDFHAWTRDRAERLRRRTDDALDWANIAEEIESLGRNNRNEIRNRLRMLLIHLLKWSYQPERRSHSWQTTISEQRSHIEGLIEDSPSLSAVPAERYEWAWRAARRSAAAETGLPLATFPEMPAFDVSDTLHPDFMPGKPWSPDDLSRG